MTAVAPGAASGRSAGVGAVKPRRRAAGWLGFTPFAAYTLVFLAVPTVLAVWSGLTDEKGAFTFANFAAFGDHVILRAFGNSIVLSLATAVVSAVIGAVICVALLAVNPTGFTRVVADAAASVFAQFGGVMLAFAFVATIGTTGLLTLFLKQTFGFDVNSIALDQTAGPLINQVSGMFFVYIYFSVPLMVIAFMPALVGLRPQWGEAVATLGGSRLRYWLHVGFPVLAPSFFGSMILVFAGAFSSYATASALTNTGVIVPIIMQQDLSSETMPGISHVPGVLAIGMIAVMAVVMWLYSLLQRRAARWQR